MFAPWRSQSSFRKHGYPITSNSFISMQATVMAVALGEMFICSKIGAKSSGDGSQDICKCTESNLGPVAGF